MRLFKILASLMACAGCLCNASVVESNATNDKSNEVSRVMLDEDLTQAEKRGIRVCSDRCGIKENTFWYALSSYPFRTLAVAVKGDEKYNYGPEWKEQGECMERCFKEKGFDANVHVHPAIGYLYSNGYEESEEVLLHLGFDEILNIDEIYSDGEPDDADIIGVEPDSGWPYDPWKNDMPGFDLKQPFVLAAAV